MRNINENLWNPTTGSSLYCVWVPVHDDGGDRLVAIWIDLAMTAFKSCAPEISDGIGMSAVVAEQEQREEEKLGNAMER
jgi:hypothetical protein